MIIEVGLAGFLRSLDLVANRVYPSVPQSAVFPLIRYQRISTLRNQTIGGEQKGPTAFTFQLDCMAKTYAESKQLADLLRKALNNYRGNMLELSVQYSIMEGETDFSEQDGDDITHWVSQRYVIYSNEVT